MAEYIRKKDAVNTLWKEPLYTDPLNVLAEARDRIESLEPADVAPVRHGKWTKLFYDGFNCNKCGSTFVIMQGRENMHFCPNCGAKMDEKRKR